MGGGTAPARDAMQPLADACVGAVASLWPKVRATRPQRPGVKDTMAPTRGSCEPKSKRRRRGDIVGSQRGGAAGNSAHKSDDACTGGPSDGIGC